MIAGLDCWTGLLDWIAGLGWLAAWLSVFVWLAKVCIPALLACISTSISVLPQHFPCAHFCLIPALPHAEKYPLGVHFYCISISNFLAFLAFPTVFRHCRTRKTIAFLMRLCAFLPYSSTASRGKVPKISTLCVYFYVYFYCISIVFCLLSSSVSIHFIQHFSICTFCFLLHFYSILLHFV